jgi:hypothetical protein
MTTACGMQLNTCHFHILAQKLPAKAAVMKTIRPIYPFGPAVGKWKSQGTVAETFARIRKQVAQQQAVGNEVGFRQQPNRPQM